MEGSTNNQAKTLWFEEESGDFETFRQQVEQKVILDEWPLAFDVEQNVLIYDGQQIDEISASPAKTKALLLEWCRALGNDGPGVIAIKGAFGDLKVLDRASEVFFEIIAKEKEAGAEASDHFAAAGANDRIWNSLEKHAYADPENFIRYYACPTLALVSHAWLGPAYQVTAQVNLVHPGGKAQVPHRDYHMGFMETARMAMFPAHAHDISPVLTLQGALAHCDMPVESGPTMLLPFSHQFREGYLAFNRQPYQDWFAANHSQLPLEKGDMVFFNPALMHGAGNNTSEDIERLVNLFQVGSAFGRSIEEVDRAKLSMAVYADLNRMLSSGDLTPQQAEFVISTSAEGYPFPTNLDTDTPVGGLNPKSMQIIMREAIGNNATPEEFNQLMAAYLGRHAGVRA